MKRLKFLNYKEIFSIPDPYLIISIYKINQLRNLYIRNLYVTSYFLFTKYIFYPYVHVIKIFKVLHIVIHKKKTPEKPNLQ